MKSRSGIFIQPDLADFDGMNAGRYTWVDRDNPPARARLAGYPLPAKGGGLK